MKETRRQGEFLAPSLVFRRGQDAKEAAPGGKRAAGRWVRGGVGRAPGPERWRPCGWEGPGGGRAGSGRAGEEGAPGRPRPGGRWAAKPGAGRGVWRRFGRTWRNPRASRPFPPLGGESLPRPINVRRAGRGLREARGLVEWLRAPGHAGSSGGRSSAESSLSLSRAGEPGAWGVTRALEALEAAGVA